MNRSLRTSHQSLQVSIKPLPTQVRPFLDWKKTMKACAPILPLLFLTLCAGCSTAPKAHQAPQVIKQLPPLALLTAIPDPYRPVKTTGDIVNRLTATESALRVCTAQIDGVRAWRVDAAAN